MVVQIRVSVKISNSELINALSALEGFISGLRWLYGASAWDSASALEVNLRAMVTKKHLMKLDAINFVLNQLGEQHISV